MKNDILRRRVNATGITARPAYRIRHLGPCRNQLSDEGEQSEDDEPTPDNEQFDDDLDRSDPDFSHAEVLAACDRLTLPTHPPQMQRVPKVDIGNLFDYSSTAVNRLLQHFWRADKAAFDKVISEPDLPPVAPAPQISTPIPSPTLTITTL